MAKICHIAIQNFRSIRAMSWVPSSGINCLVGPGDGGKSTILDAIDFCLGARRNTSFGDADFHNLDVTKPIVISVTLSDLPDALLNLDSYGDFLRGFDLASGKVEDEPRHGILTVLTFQLTVEGDLEPVWSLFSERAERDGIERGLAWKDRTALAPARIGNYANSNLSWSRNSVLNRLTDDRADLGPELAIAARQARTSFGDQADKRLADTLTRVTRVAQNLGVPVGASAKALLDAHSVSISDGAIALHNEAGIPLRSLGTGSSRLLVAGLQRESAETASIALVDEVEHGLEPHRLARLLDSLGAKEVASSLQVFMTSHSPVALRELTADQVFVVRKDVERHQVFRVGAQESMQGVLREHAEAFLAKSIVVCEGASEVGFARGLDQYWVNNGQASFFALGGAYVDTKGSNANRCFERGTALLRLGYRVLVLADADKPPTPAVVDAFHAAGGQSVTWRAGRALEDELFLSLPYVAIDKLIAKAIDILGRDLINDHLKSKSAGKIALGDLEGEWLLGEFTPATRRLLANASKGGGWFKSISVFQDVARDIVGPNLAMAEVGFQELICTLGAWTHAG
ncbi:ATP-dependent nuclease [Derxia gummosa]|uniref:ATP-dependent nuclease n=1 Tax=Derxia gummosa DSM 723 TaxID=1121388 RepID=A0A8B6XAG5_9BURK|nr:ATP-binding protein [Derxia gummosa]